MLKKDNNSRIHYGAQKFFISIIAVTIIASSIIFSITPAFDRNGNITSSNINPFYIFLGIIAAFMILLLGNLSIPQKKCQMCNRYIPHDSNICPYCGNKI